MRILGVLDLKQGKAVHARRGPREAYAAITRLGSASIPPGDALALARGYGRDFGIRELYVADLDAILHKESQRHLVKALVDLDLPVWLDAGITCLDQAKAAMDLGVEHLVVGLETLTSFAALAGICEALGGERVAFSLDLDAGTPMTAFGVAADRDAPAALARRGAQAGAGSLILLDLARIGTSKGPDFVMIEQVRGAVPDLELLVGGGIRDMRDLVRLDALGCDGVLVATALQDGRLRPEDLHSSLLR